MRYNGVIEPQKHGVYGITIFFTADVHLGHANIIKYCNRPFLSVEEMDEHLISSWNARVHSDDDVYIIGDLIFCNAKSPENYLNRLNGKKHLILGNHDKVWTKKIDMSKHFATVKQFSELSVGQHKMTLCHYPLMSWNQMIRGSYMIHGHIHNGRNGDYFSLLQRKPNLLNAGVEINNFQPVTLEELIQNNEAFKSGYIETTWKNKSIQNRTNMTNNNKIANSLPSSSSYLLEVRLTDSAKRRVKRLIFDVAEKFSVKGVTSKRVVPHITILGPFKTENEQRLIKETMETCEKYELMTIKFTGLKTFGHWLFGKRVIALNVEPAKKIELLRSELAEKLSDFCELSKFDTKKWNPHATIAFKDIDKKFRAIKNHIEKQKVPEIRQYILRITLLKNGKILREYDFLQHQTLNRQEALSRYNRQKTLRLLKEKLHNQPDKKRVYE